MNSTFVLLPCAELWTKKLGTFQNVMLCNLLATSQKNVFRPPYVWTLKMKAGCRSKISEPVYQSTQCRAVEGSNFRNHHLENIRSCINNGFCRICSQLCDLCLSMSFLCSFFQWLLAVTISLKTKCSHSVTSGYTKCTLQKLHIFQKCITVQSCRTVC
jgi:hypothetical protein